MATVENVQAPSGVKAADIACSQPTAGKGSSVRLFVAPISLHNHIATHRDLAGFTSRHGRSRRRRESGLRHPSGRIRRIAMFRRPRPCGPRPEDKRWSSATCPGRRVASGRVQTAAVRLAGVRDGSEHRHRRSRVIQRVVRWLRASERSSSARGRGERVTRSWATKPRIRSGSKAPPASMIFSAPRDSAGMRYMPLPCDSGAACRSLSSGRNEQMSARQFTAIAMRLRWLSIAPFGRPVVPEV